MPGNGEDKERRSWRHSFHLELLSKACMAALKPQKTLQCPEKHHETVTMTTGEISVIAILKYRMISSSRQVSRPGCQFVNLLHLLMWICFFLLFCTLCSCFSFPSLVPSTVLSSCACCLMHSTYPLFQVVQALPVKLLPLSWWCPP